MIELCPVAYTELANYSNFSFVRSVRCKRKFQMCLVAISTLFYLESSKWSEPFNVCFHLISDRISGSRNGTGRF